jgi:hypothetical protein
MFSPRLLGLIISATALAAGAAPAWAATSAGAAPAHRLLFGDAVVVNEDGNAAIATTFDATPGPEPRYDLEIQSGCRITRRSCPPAVSTLTVTLNNTTVFQRSGGSGTKHVPLRSDAVLAKGNQIVVTVAGAPESAARVRIFATR